MIYVPVYFDRNENWKRFKVGNFFGIFPHFIDQGAINTHELRVARKLR